MFTRKVLGPFYLSLFLFLPSSFFVLSPAVEKNDVDSFTIHDPETEQPIFVLLELPQRLPVIVERMKSFMDHVIASQHHSCDELIHELPSPLLEFFKELFRWTLAVRSDVSPNLPQLVPDY
jgi:hypothetical protein